MRALHTTIVNAARAMMLLGCVAAGTCAPLRAQEPDERGVCDVCTECEPRVAVKTNLVHDALLTPDLGVEVSIGRRFSAGAQGMWAWWSRAATHHYWRVYGGSIELRYWPGKQAGRRALTGHHVGVYGSLVSFDVEFGGIGRQAPDLMVGAGVSYGYSLRLNDRLNLDFSVRAGYAGGKVIKYEPQCGTYVCLSRGVKHYFGPTGLEITLVWFPGRGASNRPDFDY